MILLQTLMRKLSLLFFKINGWKVVGVKPALRKYVVIAAPHTSNWDFIYTICVAFIFRINPVIMMKDIWFKGPLGPIFRWLGAMAIDRSQTNDVVAQSINKFQQKKNLILIVPPSGTRQRVFYWKTGFYHIANGSGVPIVLGFLDYRLKVGGLGPTFRPTGDIEADMVYIRSFYRGILGKHPLQESRK